MFEVVDASEATVFPTIESARDACRAYERKTHNDTRIDNCADGYMVRAIEWCEGDELGYLRDAESCDA